MEENNTIIAQAHTRPSSRLEKISVYIIMATAFLLPIFFIPGGVVSVPFAKTLVLYAGVIAAFVAYLLSVLERGAVRLPANKIFFAGALIPVIFLISSLFSRAVGASVIGYGFEIGTFSFVALMFVFLFLVSTVYRSKEKIFYSYLLFLASFGIIALYQFIRLFFPQALTFGIFTNALSNTVGGWNDLGVYFAASALLALLTLELLPLSRIFRGVIYIALTLSLVSLTIINFSTLWIVLALFSFSVFTFVFLSSRQQEGSGDFRGKISYNSLAILLVSVVFIFAGDFLGTEIAQALNVANIEVRPSMGTTWEIAQRTISESALLGSGPNTFNLQWLSWKPAGINNTAFWNTDFNYGIGLVPTFLVTTGVLGILSWLGFLAAYLYTGVRAIFSGINDQLSRFLLLSSFFVSLFLWVMVIVYVPSMPIFTLAFFFTGLFAASAYAENILKTRSFTLYQSPRMGFVAVLCVVFALVLSLTAGYFVVRNLASAAYFQQSAKAAARQDVAGTEAALRRAVSLKGHDIYYRALVDLNMFVLNQLFSQNISADQLPAAQAKFQQLLASAVQNGQSAVAANPANYINHAALGRVYESVVTLKIEGAYEKALESYQRALELNPHNPEIYLLLARLEIARGNSSAARDYANKALAEKTNYVDGYFLLSQIEVAAGNVDNAIKSVESASLLDPNNAGIHFQLGLLKYNKSDWSGAIGSFERAVVLVSDYANAKYFLGLSYDKLGRRQEAIAQFEGIEASNPENQEVKLILANLRAGRQPFSNVAPPLDNQPEKRDNPPVSERE